MSGIGYETVRGLAVHGARVYIASRSKAKIEEAMSRLRHSTEEEVDLRSLVIDLQDLQSVCDAAQAFCEIETRLDILINNAGAWDPSSVLRLDECSSHEARLHLLLTRAISASASCSRTCSTSTAGT